MTDLERRALLGDKQAQEECTRQGIVLPCPTAHKPAHIDREKWGPCDFPLTEEAWAELERRVLGE